MKASEVISGAAGVGLLIGLTAVGRAEVVAQTDPTQNVRVPQGFTVSILQDGLRGPRMMSFGPDGLLYVALTSDGKIARMKVTGGKASNLETLKGGLPKPHGLAWLKDGSNNWLYVAEETRVERYKLGSDGKLGAAEVIVKDIPGGGRHTTRTVRFGPDGKMYVSVGSSTNKEPESDPRRAAILRYNPDGSIPQDNPYASSADPRRRPIWAEGLRNSVDFLWTKDGQLWASTQGSDGVKLKASDPPDVQPYERIVNLVEKGKNYGWPYCIPAKLGVNTPADKQIPDPTVQGSANYDCSSATKATPPLFTTVAHAAPLGMAWGTDSRNFPAEYKNSLYIAEHGSWNTDNPQTYRDCKVDRVVLEGGKPTKVESFATFKRGANQKCSEAWGRPAGIVFAPDGSMLISDDSGNRILRVAYSGG